MKKLRLRAVAALFILASLSAPLTAIGQLDDSGELASRLKKACQATKRNCEVVALVSKDNTTIGWYFIFNRDDFFAHRPSTDDVQISFIHAQNHDWIKLGEKEWRKTGPDEALRNLVWAPLTPSLDARDNYRPPRVESLGMEEADGEHVLHVRLVPPGQREIDNDSVPNYWLAAVGKGNWVVRRVRTLTFLGEHVVQVDARFDKIGRAPKIEPP